MRDQYQQIAENRKLSTKQDHSPKRVQVIVSKENKNAFSHSLENKNTEQKPQSDRQENQLELQKERLLAQKKEAIEALQ